MSKVNSVLKEMRRKKKLTQEQLALKLNVSRVAISLWESGKREPDLDTLMKLSVIYDLSLDELITGVK